MWRRGREKGRANVAVVAKPGGTERKLTPPPNMPTFAFSFAILRSKSAYQAKKLNVADCTPVRAQTGDIEKGDHYGKRRKLIHENI